MSEGLLFVQMLSLLQVPSGLIKLHIIGQYTFGSDDREQLRYDIFCIA